VPYLAALDLLDEVPPSIPRGTLTRKAALRRLRAVAAALHEPPPDGFGRAIAVDAAAASVTGGVGTPRGGGNRCDRLVDRARRGFRRKSTCSLTAGRVSPADFPAARCSRTLMRTHAVLSESGYGCGYLSRDIRTHTAGQEHLKLREHEKT